VVSLSCETAGGAEEEEDSGDMAPSSLRSTVTLRLKEDAAPATFGLAVRASWKDYLQQAGDYAYVQVNQDGTLRLSPAVKLGWNVAVKDTWYDDLDSQGASRDLVTLKAGSDAVLTPWKGITLDLGLDARWELAESEARNRQVYAGSASFSARLGGWVLGIRCRGEVRLPLGAAATAAAATFATGAVTLQWDPNP
jgi:hypothetical protein